MKYHFFDIFDFCVILQSELLDNVCLKFMFNYDANEKENEDWKKKTGFMLSKDVDSKIFSVDIPFFFLYLSI